LTADIDERIRRILVAVVLDQLFEARKRNYVPPFLAVIEEGHRFAPQEEETYCKKVLRKIAREGRKFGFGLCITSQRIVGLDKDVLSQCGTKIILRIDSRTDLDFLAPFLEYTSPEEFARVPYLPNGVAVVSGVTVRSPTITCVRERRSKHGGDGAKILPSNPYNLNQVQARNTLA
jgi:DNA helicase HerA-like ATPase